MALVTLANSTTIAAADLQTNFDDARAQMAANAKAGSKDWQVDIERLALANADDISLRTVEFTPQDDAELRVLGVQAFAGIVRTITLTLTAITAAGVAIPRFLVDQSVVVTLTTTAGAEDYARVDYRTTTNARIFLLAGVLYRLTLANSGTAVTRAYGFALLRSRRRRA